MLSYEDQMKRIGHPYLTRGPLGLYYEQKLKPTLESIVKEHLVKTEETYETMDFESENCFVELKTRSDQYHYSQSFIKRDGWLLPFCKIERARKEIQKGKKVYFFYFWKAGKSLWIWEFSEEGCLDMKKKYPPWHEDQQEQAYIQERHWKRIY